MLMPSGRGPPVDYETVSPARPRHPQTPESGLTLVEVMVASFVLMVGILSTFSMVDAAQQTTRENTGRTAASNLAREVVEQARSLDYNTALTPAALTASFPQVRPDRFSGVAGDQAASRCTLSSASAASTTPAKRLTGSSGTRIENCDLPDS